MNATAWPPLPLAEWEPTDATLHMWTQVVGKVCLASTPLVNHHWNVTLRVTARGLSTPTLFKGDRAFQLAFDLVDHRLNVLCSDGDRASISLAPMTVADFYAELMSTLHDCDLDIQLRPVPVEVPNPIPFTDDTVHRSYEREHAARFFRVLISVHRVFEQFRAQFLGKCSPVHFFWGSFDLAVTRFSGRRAPARAGADAVTREAYSHEVISHGFWPGGSGVPDAAFYAYAAPEPAGFASAVKGLSSAYYDEKLGEHLLMYEAVRASPEPERMLDNFLQSTYQAAAELAGWNRAELERAARAEP